MDVPVASMGAFRQAHALLFLSVETSVPSPEASRDAVSVHGSVGAAVMDDSTEHPLFFFRESSGGFHGSLRGRILLSRKLSLQLLPWKLSWK